MKSFHPFFYGSITKACSLIGFFQEVPNLNGCVLFDEDVGPDRFKAVRMDRSISPPDQHFTPQGRRPIYRQFWLLLSVAKIKRKRTQVQQGQLHFAWEE